MKILITVPSYNERPNIASLIDVILAQGENYYVCIVDDNSPDGTPEELRRYMSELQPEVRERVHLIVRSKKDGRGGAVRDGITWGLTSPQAFDIFVEMDADFSHPPTDLPKGVAMLSQADVVLGSRYPDGTIIGWPLMRTVFSRVANTLARTLIDWNIADYTNGFRFYSRASAAYMCSMPQKHKGYIYLSETISYFLAAGYTFKSFPIIFVNRKRGQSNATLGEVRRAFVGIFMIAWEYRFRRSPIVKPQ